MAKNGIIYRKDLKHYRKLSEVLYRTMARGKILI